MNITNFCHNYHHFGCFLVISVAKVSDVHQIVFTVQGVYGGACEGEIFT